MYSYIHQPLLVQVQLVKGPLHIPRSIPAHRPYHHLHKLVIHHLTHLPQIKRLVSILHIHLDHLQTNLIYTTLKIAIIQCTLSFLIFFSK